MSAQPQPEALVDDPEDGLEEPAGIGFDGPPPSIDELLANEDAPALVELGAAYRVGTPFVERDAFKALECFEAASRLGDADAEYLVGLAYFNGAGIGKDAAEGAKRMRSAAQRGSLRAKVYVANLYEMGVHYAHDAEKADVWYRNVARAAGIDSAPDTDEHELAMAELGCVRHCLALVADESLPKKDRAFYLKKAKAMGYGHRLKQAKAVAEPAADATAGDRDVAQDTPAESSPDAPAPGGDEATEPSEGEPKADPKAKETAGDDVEEEVLLGGQWTFAAGTLAFLAASFFLTAAAVAGWLAMEGSRALAEAGRAIPGIGTSHWAILAGTLVALGLLPATATYRPKVVASAALFGAATATGAWYAWDVQHVLWDRVVQAAAGGLAGVALVLLLLGLLGGTRARPNKTKKLDRPA